MFVGERKATYLAVIRFTNSSPRRDAFLADYADRADTRGRKHVVRNGYLPGQIIMTGAGPLEIEQS